MYHYIYHDEHVRLMNKTSSPAVSCIPFLQDFIPDTLILVLYAFAVDIPVHKSPFVRVALAVYLLDGLLRVGLLRGRIRHDGLLLGVNLGGIVPAANKCAHGSSAKNTNKLKPEAEHSIFSWQLSRPSYFRSVPPSSFGAGGTPSADNSSDGDVVAASTSTTVLLA